MLKRLKEIKYNHIIVTIVGIILLLYVIYKAATTSFTHDESYSFLKYVHQPFMDIISYKTAYTNNHILNSVLMKYSEVFFGNSEFALRLPNVLAFVLYLFFVFSFLNKNCKSLLVPGFILFTVHPYLLDFFSLARGYGLSIAFMTMSIYYLVESLKTPSRSNLSLFNMAAFFAVFSNFSMLNFYVAAIIIFIVLRFVSSREKYNASSFLADNKVNGISLLIFIAFLFEPIRRISKMKLLDFGGKQGFLFDTVGSSLDDLVYEMHITDGWVLILKIMICLIAFGSLLVVFIKLLQKNLVWVNSNISLIVVTCVLFVVVAISILQHWLLGNDFYIHRFALFFYVLFVFVAVSILHLASVKMNHLIKIASYLLACLWLLNFIVNHNLTYYKDWKFDQNTKQVMSYLEEHHQNNKQIRLGVTWLLEPSTNYYRYAKNLNWILPTHRRGVQQLDDYWYILKEDENYNSINGEPRLLEDVKIGSFLVKNRD